MKKLLTKALIAGAMLGVIKVGVDMASNSIVNKIFSETVEGTPELVSAIATSEILGGVVNNG